MAALGAEIVTGICPTYGCLGGSGEVSPLGG